MVENVFHPNNWSGVPFHFWSVVFFVFGTMIGSFLNVCIHRLPLEQSIVSPPSHCPHCKYSIPWYLNLPLVTWLMLGGKCRNCSAPISMRYFLVELLTGVTFLLIWLMFGHQSVGVVLVYDILLAGLIAATFIDFEHFIIPDEITIGGMIVGFICSFLVPALHDTTLMGAMRQSLIGMAFGAGLVYAILRLGKLLFGRQKLALPEGAKIIFTETSVVLPDQEIPYEDIFYRPSDAITLQATTLELVDRCYKNVRVKLSPSSLHIDDEKMNPEDVPHMEAVSASIILPREAMGFGDVKFMGAIGAFLGWQSVVFSLMVSSIIGSLVGLTLILTGKREWSSRLPYGPYIALAAALWVFAGKQIVELFFRFGNWVAVHRAGPLLVFSSLALLVAMLLTIRLLRTSTPPQTAT